MSNSKTKIKIKFPKVGSDVNFAKVSINCLAFVRSTKYCYLSYIDHVHVLGMFKSRFYYTVSY